MDDVTAGQRGYWIHNNNNGLFFMGDRTDDGTWTGDTPWPLQLFADTTPAGDYALFSNQVRAASYCDRTGQNCLETTSGERILKTAGIRNSTPLSFDEARQLWNNHVQKTWDNAAGTPLRSSPDWLTTCLWDSDERSPTENNTWGLTEKERLQHCGLIMCRYHPELKPLTKNQVVLSDTAACPSPGGAACQLGVFNVNCIY